MANNFLKSGTPAEKCLSVSTILNVVDALVYVADMETHELIFINQYGIEHWGEPQGRRCWEVLQSNQTGPCAFCTNNKLRDEQGNATGVYVWDFRNTVTRRWFQCRDQAIPWTDGRLVRVEIATDITERVEAENRLKLAKAQSDKLARTDDLTGIRNRRALFEDSAQVFNLAKRYRHMASVIMLDIDHFKFVNDQYGHSVGDKVLQSLVNTLQNNIREVDILGRLGGEEFALVLPETDLEEAIKTAEKLRLKVSNMIIDDNQLKLAISCSFGVAAGDGVNCSFEKVLSQADKALYLAKDNGRNRVESYSVELMDISRISSAAS